MNRRWICLVLITCLVLIIIPANVAQATGSIIITEENMYDVIEDLEQYIHRAGNGTLHLQLGKAIQAGYNRCDLKALQDHLHSLNQRILNGEITTDDNLNIITIKSIFNIEDSIECTCNAGDSDYSIFCSKGINKFEQFWWGYRRHACACETNRIVAQLNTYAAIGGGASVLAAIFSGPVAAYIGVPTAYILLLASRASYHNTANTGVVMTMTYAFVFSVKSQ